MVWPVLLCSRTRYASVSLACYLSYLRLFGLLCLTVCDHIISCVPLGRRISTGILGVMMSLGEEQPPAKTTLEQSDLTVKSDIEKQRHSSGTIIGQTLRGVTTKKYYRHKNRSQFGNDSNLEINVFPCYFVQALRMPRSKNSSGLYCKKITICAILASLAQSTYPIRPRCGTDKAGRGAFEPSPEDGARTKRFDQEISYLVSITIEQKRQTVYFLDEEIVQSTPGVSQIRIFGKCDHIETMKQCCRYPHIETRLSKRCLYTTVHCQLC